MSNRALTRVDSEIALTALLATLVTAYPSSAGSFYPLIKLVALGLLVLTLARRMSVEEGGEVKERLLLPTTHALDSATIVSILYLAHFLVAQFAPPFDTLGFPVWFGMTTPLLAFAGFLTWEIGYRAGISEGQRVFSVSGRQHGGVFGGLLDGISSYLDENYWAKENNTRQAELSDFSPDDASRNFDDLEIEEQIRILRGIVVALFSLLAPVIAYLVVIWVSGYLFGGSLLIRGLVLFSVLVVSGGVQLWYSNYGVVQIEDRNGYLTFAGEATAYLLFGFILF